MPDIALRFNTDVLVIDGALGTMLQKAGVVDEDGMCAELLNVMDPEVIVDLHRRYLAAGAHCVTTNSFGASRAKLAAYGLEDRVEELNRAAVRCAKASGAVHVLADVGPCGLVMEPLGQASFSEVYAQYHEQASALAAEEPDAILIETMTDIADARCALVAARDACDLPVFVSCTFGENGRMELSGTDAESAAVILEAAGASVIGLNCSLGPEQMLPILEELACATSLPLLIQPNAGMPVADSRGQAHYSVAAEAFADAAVRFRAAGAQFIGSCCGSTPAYTSAIFAAVGDMPIAVRPAPRTAGLCALASPRRTVLLGKGRKARVIGERINPTGKPDLTRQLEAGNMSLVLSFAEAQTAAGADLLDVNVGAPMVDEALVLPMAVRALASFTDAPLVIDTTNPVALEAALKAYPGKALINSVNGEADSLAFVLPLAKRYGAAVVALALDGSGIPSTLEGRKAVVRRILAQAQAVGLRREDIVVDMLVMTAATDAGAPLVTISGVQAMAEGGLATVLGVSNVSHGLPGRQQLNAAFVRAALAAGLSAAIVNPNAEAVLEAMAAHNDNPGALGLTEALEQWEHACSEAMAAALAPGSGEAAKPEAFSGQGKPSAAGGAVGAAAGPDAAPSALAACEDALRQAVLRGDADAVPELVDAVAASGCAPERVVDTLLAPTMSELGDAFGRGEAFLPQMIIAANAMKAAVAHIKTLLPAASSADCRGTVVFCTVKGDVHSIGKDICIALLESQDFRVVDLGVDVEPDDVVAAARREGADAVCLSALMTTTLPNMKLTVERIYAEAPEYRDNPRKGVFVGGAVVSQAWADSVGALYTDDAPSCTTAIRDLVGACK